MQTATRAHVACHPITTRTSLCAIARVEPIADRGSLDALVGPTLWLPHPPTTTGASVRTCPAVTVCHPPRRTPSALPHRLPLPLASSTARGRLKTRSPFSVLARVNNKANQERLRGSNMTNQCTCSDTGRGQQTPTPNMQHTIADAVRHTDTRTHRRRHTERATPATSQET